ncbi:MAG: hypothetical protein WAJ88_08540 [Pseudolabrys sp.]
MTRSFIAMLIVGLGLGFAGCTSTSSLFTSNEPPPPPPAPEQSAVPQTSQAAPQAGPRGPMTPAASAAASSTTGAAPGELLECVTQSCKINCSQKVKPQFRPKWCANFKSPD